VRMARMSSSTTDSESAYTAHCSASHIVHVNHPSRRECVSEVRTRFKAAASLTRERSKQVLDTRSRWHVPWCRVFVRNCKTVLLPYCDRRSSLPNAIPPQGSGPLLRSRRTARRSRHTHAQHCATNYSSAWRAAVFGGGKNLEHAGGSQLQRSNTRAYGASISVVRRGRGDGSGSVASERRW